MSNGIVAGSTVRLKSGGPMMTVIHINDGGSGPVATCIWFDNAKETRGVFPVVALEAESMD